MTHPRPILIFDVDGTLVDSTYHHAMAWGRAFRAYGLEVPAWQVHRSIGMGGDRLVAHLCGDRVETKVGDGLRQRWSEAYERLRSEVNALPGARRLLETVQQRGNVICVASSGSRHDTDEALDLVGVTGLLHSVTTGDEVDKSKPDPDVIERSWQGAGAGPAVVIGDSVYDVHAAARLDLPCVAVRTGGFGSEELMAAGAVLVVDDLTALFDYDWSTAYSGR